MSFTPPNTFSTATPIEAELIKENLDAIKDYLNGGIVSGDISTSDWIKANHLVRGRYNPLIQQMKFVSGIIQGRNFSVLSSELSFLPDAPTAGNAPSTPTLVYQPNCSFDFYLDADADVLFQFYGSPIAVSMPRVNPGTLPGAQLDQFVWRIYVDDDEQTATEFKTQWIGTAARYEKAFLTQFWAGSLSSGSHTISIKGYAEAPYCILAAWGLSLETYPKS